jgi:hypothetical protein
VRKGSPSHLGVNFFSQLKETCSPEWIPFIVFTLKIRCGDLKILPAQKSMTPSGHFYLVQDI